MSPAGIPLFYASADAETAIAEIAGHGVEPFAVVGEFRNVRPVRVLDLTRRPSRPSPFDSSRRRESQMAAFLDLFVSSITHPVIPDGRQHVEYAPTQVLTEFLRWAPERKIDGLILPSAQTSRPTYVLFYDQAGFTTVGQEEATAPRHALLDFDESDDRPTFSLDPSDVTVYEVHRQYRASPASVWQARI
jgi:hypothetical protein